MFGTAITMAAAALLAAPDPSGRIGPAEPWIEATAGGPSANFDILIVNPGKDAVEVAEIEVTYADAEGRPVWTRRLDGNGSVPSIRTIGDAKIEPGAERLFFNPCPVAPPGLDPRRVTVKVSFDAGKDRPVPPPAVASAKLRPAPAGAAGLLLPVTGRVLVWDGHDALSHHRRWDHSIPYLRGLGFASNAMRYSYDFVPVDAEGRMATGDGKVNANYVGFGMAVRAAAAGTVVAAVSDRPDDHSFDPEQSRADPNSLFGNYVVVRQADGLFAVYGHVKQGSALVRPGDRVIAGQRIAAIGASGSSLFPHLHFQLMDGPTMRAEGVPSRFRGVVRLAGARRMPLALGHVDSGDLVFSR
jgi:hypothetical protein